ncbi:hypothetical protein [Albirhodobacter sp. R86504]|uniref:hypothetical protein n=1 Tax=Albirhodobacter sp. R86504 TaxID=3093848 RepID=UPI00366CF0B2
MSSETHRRRICPHCSTALPEDAEICAICGQVLGPVEAPIPMVRPKAILRRALDFALTLLVVFFVAMALQHYYLSIVAEGAHGEADAAAHGLPGPDAAGKGAKDPSP